MTTEIATLKDVMTLGEVLARSGFFQDARGAAQAVVKVLAGRELGFGPIASMTGVHIVKGKPVLSATLMAAAVQRSRKYRFRVMELTEKVCKIVFYEGDAQIGESAFSWDDAVKAGLVGNPTWKSYARNMLYARALSNGARWYTPEVFGGPVYTPEELGIDIDGETGEVKNLSSVTVAEQPVAALPASDPPSATDPDAHRAESEALFPKPEDEQKAALVVELGLAIVNLKKTKRATAADVDTWKETYLGSANADPRECDIAALSDLKKYLQSRFPEIAWKA